MIYIAFHKPLNVVCTRNIEEEARKERKRKKTLPEFKMHESIYDVAERNGFPVADLGLVGRLDSMTSGIMLFTNDSKLQQRLLLPEDLDEEKGKMVHSDKEQDPEGWKEKIDKNIVDDFNALRKYKTKVYHLDVLASPYHQWGSAWSEEKQQSLCEELSAPLTFSQKGIEYTTSPAEISIIERYRSAEHSHGGKGPRGADLGWCVKVKVVLREGKHHQIRRIAARSKLTVRSLTRVSFAGGVLTLEDDALKQPGSGRRLQEDEVQELREAFALS